MATSTIQEHDRQFVETWESVADSQYAVIKLDARGDDRPEVVLPGRKVMLTTQERIFTQDRCLDPINDPFVNGSFRPLIVPDTVDRTTNPNALSHEEILNVLRSSEFAFGEYLTIIDSPQTLRRLVDACDEADVPVSRMRRLQQRLDDVKPRTRIGVKEADRALYEKIDRPSSSDVRSTGSERRLG